MENASEPEAPRMSIQTKRSYKIHQRYHTPWKKSLKIHPKIPIQFDNKASQNTLPSLPEKPARQVCAACHRGFVGGWLLGCRNSAKTVFQKSELASCSRSDSGLLKNNADFRQPRISSPPAEADQAASPARAVRFRAVGLGWLGGSWMSRQRCAGRRRGKAEFLCGLMGRGWAEALCCRLGVCRIVVEFLDGFCVIFSLVHGMVGISYKIFCLYGHSWSFGF